MDKIPAMPDGISRSDRWRLLDRRRRAFISFTAAAGALSETADLGVSYRRAFVAMYVAKPAGLVFKVDSTGKPADALYDLTGDASTLCRR